MKKMIVIALTVVVVAGCGEQQKQKPFTIQDVKLGMQKELVEQMCNGILEFASSNIIPNSNGCSLDVYRMWPNATRDIFRQIASRSPAGSLVLQADKKDTKPYLLAFIIYPPLTKEQCNQIAEIENVTDPNELEIIMSLEGHQPSKLIAISQDMETIKLQTIQKRHVTNQQLQNQQLQQIQWQLEQMEHKASFDRLQRGGLP